MKTDVSKQAAPRRRFVRRLLIAATVGCVLLGVVGIGVVAAVGVGIRQALEKSGYLEDWTDADGVCVDGARVERRASKPERFDGALQNSVQKRDRGSIIRRRDARFRRP
ncbi:MAG: hypothetical protein IJE97_06210 [Thermoguttaceae bacterium]|nr:hypothetical protein [Thermoguttaceae bacterium]